MLGYARDDVAAMYKSLMAVSSSELEYDRAIDLDAQKAFLKESIP